MVEGPRQIEKVPPDDDNADLALKFDPAYEKIARRFQQNPEEFADAFARAWFKLTHREWVPARVSRLEVPKEELIWQTGARRRPYARRSEGYRGLKGRILASAFRFGIGFRRMGLGVDFRAPTSARRQRCAHSPGAQKDWKSTSPHGSPK